MFFTKKDNKILKDSNFMIKQLYNKDFTNSYKDNRDSISEKIIQGENNNIFIIDKKGKKELLNIDSISGLKIEIIGNNNTVILPREAIWFESKIYIKSNDSKITINHTNMLLKMDIYIQHGDNQELFIDKKFSSGGAFIALIEKDSKVKIGQDCMFSTDICLMAGDGHTIKDKKSRQIINFSKGITIGNHVWISKYAKILKNTIIPSNSIVGMASIVNGTFEKENVIIAGTPAKVIKEDIEWERDSISQYK